MCSETITRHNWHSEVTWPDKGEDGSKVGKPLSPGVSQYIFNSTKRHLIRSWRPLSPRKKKSYPISSFSKSSGCLSLQLYEKKKNQFTRNIFKHVIWMPFMISFNKRNTFNQFYFNELFWNQKCSKSTSLIHLLF